MTRRHSDDLAAGPMASDAPALIASHAPRLIVSKARSEGSEAHTQEALLDLRAHSMALEMQNRELRESYRGLERARALYFELFDSAPLPYLLFDERHHLRELNAAAGELLRGDRSRLKHRPFFPHLVDQDRPAFHEHLSEVFRHRTRAEVELLVLDADVTHHRVRLISQIVPGGPGEKALCMSVMLPVATLAAAPSRPAPDLVWWPRHLELAGLLSLVTSPELGCLFLSDRLCEALGFKPAELLSKNWRSLTDTPSYREEAALMAQLRSGARDSYTLTKRIRRRDQRLVAAEETVTAIRSSNRRILACLHTVELDDRSASHSTEMAASRCKRADADLENWLLVCVDGKAPRFADASAARAKAIEIPEDILSRWSQLELADLNRLVVDTCAALVIDPASRLEMNLQDTLPLIRHCGWQMSRALRNLISNAFEASQNHGGGVRIATRVTWMEAELVDPTGAERPMSAGNYGVIEVTDAGVGMSPQTLAKAFDPFFSTKSGHAGLGLSAARAVMDRHQGFIRCTSHVDRGTVAQVFIPLGPAMHREPTTHSSSESQLALFSGALQKILLVDDEPGVRGVVARMLETLGYHVDEVGSGAEALDRFKPAPFAYRAVISDLNMPQMDGLSLVRALQGIRPDCGCVLMTGSCDPGDWGTSNHGSGKITYLQKPFTLAHLEEILSRQPGATSFPSMRTL